MRSRSMLKWIAVLGACMFLGVLTGCTQLEYAPKKQFMYYHKELPAAERAVEAARAAGKDKECPAQFQAAEKAKDEAYEIYWSCRTKEAIAKANEATAMAAALCPAKSVRVVAPPPPPPPPAAKVVDRLTIHVNFDFDKSDIRKADVPELQKAVTFVKKYSKENISIEGHTDNIGTEKYNQGLSERRAAAVKKYLEENADTRADKVTSVGYGKTRPVADNKTEEGRFMNRRVEILILSQ